MKRKRATRKTKSVEITEYERQQTKRMKQNAQSTEKETQINDSNSDSRNEENEMKGKRTRQTTKSVKKRESERQQMKRKKQNEIQINEENEANLIVALQNEELPIEEHDVEKDGSDIEYTSNAPNRKSKQANKRGPSKGLKSVDEPMFLEFDSLNNPIGKWAHAYGVHIGTCAYRIDINVGSYFDLSEAEKNMNWEETKTLFNIEEPDLDKKEAKLHSLVASRFRNWKTKLRRRWLMNNRAICDEHDEQSSHEEQDEHSGSEEEGNKSKKQKKNEDVPWVKYAGLISRDQWMEFERSYYSDEFQATSQKARASGKLNEHPHRMGQNSYAQSEEKWIKDGRLSPPQAIESFNSGSDSNASIAERVSRRPIIWKLAHEKKLPDGSWGIDPSSNKTKDIAQKIDQHLEEEAKAKEDGTFVEEYGMDALSKALGKRDHRGRTIAIGGINIGLEKTFGKVNRRSPKAKRNNGGLSQELADKLLEFQLKLEKEFDQRVAIAVEKALTNRLGMGSLTKETTPLPDTPNSSVNKDVSICAPRILMANTPCHLAIMDSHTKNLVVVADGMAFPYDSSNPVMHNEEARVDHYKVSLDNPYPKHNNVDLPCVSKDGQTTKVGQAKGHFLEWPVDQVIFMDEEVGTFEG